MNKAFTLQILEDTVERTMKDMGNIETNLLHAALGVGGEAGELQDLVKKITIYKSRNLADSEVLNTLAYELGDILWYIQLGAMTLGFSMDTIIRMNQTKLALRYPDKFSIADSDAKVDKETTGELE